MKISTTYSVKIKEYNHIFQDTVKQYRSAVSFFCQVINDNWDQYSKLTNQISAVNLTEQLTVRTAKRPSVPYDFGAEHYKFPSYLRRAAIAESYGMVSSYRSNLRNWENGDPRVRGKRPSVPKSGNFYPAMYRGNTYERTGDYTARLKVFIRNTWDWIDISLRKSDVDYIKRHCSTRKQCVPTLRKRGKEWFLDFAFEEKAEVNDTEITEQTVVSVDLGINSACALSVMRSDGTVIGRHFLSLPKEYDSLKRKISKIKRAQRHGSLLVSGLWRIADGVNDDIAVKTAQFIIDTAVLYNADVIVFEHLDLQGKKRGSRKQRLHLWKARYVQSMVTDKAHRLHMRISHVNAWGTSALAFDGSGRVKRGRDSEKTNGNYSLCEFTTGKVYNCDLNASYNIGARYFVRELIKSLPVTDGQRIAAKVPGCAKRSTCTLSTLISLNAELYAAA